MRYHNITKDDMLNGEGLRVVLWVAGCSHGCKNCQNPITWDPNGGLPFDEAAKAEIFAELEKDYISGITFSGGDPLYMGNREDVTALAKEIKEAFPDKKTWLYTGYLWEEVSALPIMQYLDVIVDGRFVEELKDPQLHWKGSFNQRIIDVQKSQKGRVCNALPQHHKRRYAQWRRAASGFVGSGMLPRLQKLPEPHHMGPQRRSAL